MSKGQLNYITVLVIFLSGFSITTANPCAGVWFGNVPHEVEEYCHKYYACILTIANERTCNAGHVFHERVSDCAPGSWDTCEVWSETTTTTTTTEATTHSSSTDRTSTVNPHNPCHGLYHGERVPHENPEFCFLFYHCIAQIPVPDSCHHEHIFDRYQKKCVPGDWDTCLPHTIPPETTHPVPETTPPKPETTSSTTTVNPHNPCHGLHHGEQVPHENPEFCYLFYSCIEEGPVPGTCDYEYIFDRTQRRCISGDWDTCLPHTIPPETTPTPPVETTTPSDLDEICQGVFFAARPWPGSEYSYVGCIRSHGTLHDCYEGEYFSREINECVLVPTTTTTTTTSRPIVTTLPPDLKNICKGLHHEYIEYPGVCALYIYCYEGYDTILECPEFKIFDVDRQECRYGNQTTCQFLEENTVTATEPTPGTFLPTTESSHVPTTVASTLEPTPDRTTPVETTTLFNPCFGVPSGNVPNLDDCTKYYQCLANGAFYRPMNCDEGKIFDRERLVCVDGDKDSCDD